MSKNRKPDSGLMFFLAEKLKISRSQARKIIDNELVKVNKKLPKKAGDKLTESDICVIARPRLAGPKQSHRLVVPANLAGSDGNGIATLALAQPRFGEARSFAPLGRGSFLAMTPKIVAEDTDYLVINKPTGLLTHPTLADEPNALTKILVKKYPEIKKVGDDPRLRPGIVHRLDKEASGLLVVARTQKMFDHLKQQFKDRKIDKEYLVLVHGKVAKDEGVINFAISRSRTGDKMASIPSGVEKGFKPVATDTGGVETLHCNVFTASDHSRDALTEFFVEKRFVNFTLLRVKIHTGRMHQIRVHMLAYNHPVVGDPLYFQKKRKRTWDNKLGRLFLHCTKLGFRDLNDEWKVFESELPKELEEFLKILK